MSNSFNKEERVAFEQILEGFNDALVLSKNVNVYSTDSQMMERASDTVWRPQPYIVSSYDGMDQTANFQGATQLSVPSTLGFEKSVPWTMDAKELRDALQENRLGDSAKKRLASDINVAVMNTASTYGSLVVARDEAATGFDDVAEADALMNEQGIMMEDRFMALSSRDYNKMAGNLANRQTLNGKPLTAYDRAYIGQIAGFETFKLDYANRLAAATAVTATVGAVNQYHTPKATSIASTGERSNVDNRFQNLTVGVFSGAFAAGDAFTIAGVNAVHHITKQDTGQLKTFRVVEVVNATTIKITPAIVSGGGATDAELQYQNVTATPANGAAITLLNANASAINPFWHKDSIELMPGRYAVDGNTGAQIMRAKTDQGIEVVLQKQYDINTMVTKYRLDTLFGVTNVNPEMSGIMIFGQNPTP